MKISIITVTYNASGVLWKTMESIAAQTRIQDIEYLIIDGASKDETMSLVQKFSEEHPALAMRWISEPDKGLYDAMNKGIAMATGDFVWFINAGDKIYREVTAEKIAEAYSQQPDADVIYGQCLIIDHDDRPLGERHKIAPKVLTKKSLLKGLVVCHQSILIRRSMAPQYDLRYKVSADYDWTCRMLEVSHKNLYIDDYLSRFMLAGISSTNRKRSWKERFDSMRRHFGLLPTLWAHFIIVLKYPFGRKAR